MFLVVELLFIVLLVIVLIMLYRNERSSSRYSSPQARAEEYWSGKERRKHVRFKKILEVDYTVRKKPRLKNDARTADISEGGMKIVLYEKLAKGTIMEIRIPLPGLNRMAVVEGEVMWSEEAHEHPASTKRIFYSGIRFRALKDPSDSSLFTYIRSLPSSAVDEK